jgi:hypothetical protein
MPGNVKPRPSRAERAHATRRRIVAVAASQFVAHGYGATLLDRVAGTDPEVAAQWDAEQAETRAAHGLADLLARRGARKPGLDVEQARDIAFVLSNAETYLQFTDVCEWTPDESHERTAA